MTYRFYLLAQTALQQKNALLNRIKSDFAMEKANNHASIISRICLQIPLAQKILIMKALLTSKFITMSLIRMMKPGQKT